MVNQDKVAIFWDFENCCPPSTQGLGYDIVNNIGRMARIFGSVTTFKAYLDISSQPPKSTALRSELQLSGVSVVDCPHNGKKDVVDKMAMVDMFAFAVDNPAPATVILIAADRDYAYALSTLRLRNYKVVLITPCVSTCLEACASFVIDWNATSLPVERQSTPTNPAGGVSTEPRDSDNSSGVSSPIFQQIVAPLSGPSPPIPAIATDLATAHCFHKGDHPPADILTTGRISSPFSQPSLHGSRIPPISANSDNNTIVPADKSSTNIVPSQKEPTLSTEKQMTYANSVEGIAKEPMGNRNPFRISFPASHAALNVIPGSPVAQTQACPASDMPTSTATGQVNRKQTRWQFLPLIRVLVVDRRKRIFRSNHSDIAMALMQIDKNAYKRVGATRFKHYITLAQRVGLVVLGGAENDAWIALHPEWFSEAERTEYQSNTAMEGNSCGVDGNQTSTSREIGAGCFQPLVDILVQFHQSGVRPVLRSRIGQMLEPTVYQEAGVPGFAEYVARAAEVGIVMCGGVGGYAWIRLHPDVETQVNDTYHM
ncbi:NYN domain-containing protein [Pisolithus orientalis]|uniref:NYN domain-containing protein n=1 Tax=Pisolithus orientalis TaxID=936130 RepID=UPI0022252DFA|nr:NYN domain-containing protein [Pisolithus orientalis]KAI6028328.1 NYN domain-containing protein [Pisolithus orientalis]